MVSLHRRTVHTAAVAIAAALATSGVGRADELAALAVTDQVNAQMGLAASEVVDLEFDRTLEVAKEIVVVLDGNPYLLDLAPHSVRDPEYQVYEIGADGVRVPVPNSPVNTFRGSVRQMPDSRVSLGIMEDGLLARVDLGDGSEAYWIEPVPRAIPGVEPGMHVVYHSSDVLDTGGRCGVVEVEQVAANAIARAKGEQVAFGTGGLCTAQLGVDTDNAFYNDFGQNTTAVENRVNSVINTMNNQYESEVFITHQITAILVRTTGGAPYTASTIGGLLTQFQNEWNANQGAINRDLAHLFTGVSFPGSTIGIAFSGTVCFEFSAYAVVENEGFFSCATDLSAHEIGHNWNAAHCLCSNQFSGQSIATITNFRNTRTCLTCDPFTEYCSASSIITLNRWITRVRLADIDNTSAAGNYQDFTDVTTELTRGETYDLTVDMGGSNTSATIGGMWIDRTVDNDFDDPLETIADQDDLNGSGPYTASLTLIGYSLGPTRVRVRVQDNSSDPLTLPCGDTTRGEVEDYTVIIVDPPMGACCFPSFEGCNILEEEACITSGGEFLGLGFLCADCVFGCAEDLDGDNEVGFTDLTQLLAAWGSCPGCPEDLNDDGEVGFADLTQLLAAWGPC
jgi:hypothetical protein